MTDPTFTVVGQIELPCPHCHNRPLHPNLRCADVRHGMTYYIVTRPGVPSQCGPQCPRGSNPHPPDEFTALAGPCQTCGGTGCSLDFCRDCGDEYNEPCMAHEDHPHWSLGCEDEPCCPDCFEGKPTANLVTRRNWVTHPGPHGKPITQHDGDPIGRATLARLLPVKDRPSGPERGDGPMVYLFGSCWWLWFDEGNYHAIKLPANVDPGWWVALMEATDD